MADRAGAILVLGVVGVVLLAVLAWVWWGNDPSVLRALRPTAAEVEAFAAAWGGWAAAASILLMVAHSFLPFPAEAIAVANGMMFGTLGGIAVTWAGAMLGALAAFALTRWLGRPALCRFVKEGHRAEVERRVRHPGALLILRLVPVVSFNLVNVAAGLAGASYWSFLWTTAVGILPLTVASVILGAHIFEIGWPVWTAIGAAVVAASLLLRRLAARKA